MSIEDWIRGRQSGRAGGVGAARVIDVLTSQPQFASYAPARQVADEAGVDISTVTRTAQSLGFRGWPALQLEIRNRYLDTMTAQEILTDHADGTTDPVTAAFRTDMANLALATRTIEIETVRRLADTIRRARRTLVIASGSYLAPAIMLAHVGSLSGLDIDYDDVGGTHRATLVARMGPDDCLVIFNVWRLPRDVLAITRVARDRGVVTAVITDRRSSPLAELGDHVVTVPSEGPAYFPSLTPAMSLINAILNQIVADDPERVRAAISAAGEMWQELDLMDDDLKRT
ncbi:MurR/RpiR family transcriptional regulator [Williamsia sterculiae]|uniref:Transcriptional regulator, RpiR family n=1 Tax=Williamsia sterculiae TaxID=1344003 RepID=A0A1N7D1W9_9NOCA|nr:MurR/RpiR family transcriptional regulator [Williamsia sterculiae]SIR69843.1 transcriptional regulator, RpiR family [Williamsia sterculiae]